MKAPVKKSARTARPSRQGILVLGMHRSGTSALTRVLNLLGCALPANLIGPGDGNELGHWEAADAVTLNDEILASAGSSWEDWGPINEDWKQSGLRPEMLQRITALVEKHAELGPLFAVKDPRICRIAELWLEGMDVAAIEPLVVLMVRNPAEVIRSLESRDLMATSYGQLLWLRHVLDAEFASRGRKRVVCRYDQLLQNWRGMIAQIKVGLGVSLPRNSPKIHSEIQAFLSSEQRHQNVEIKAALDDPWLSEWVRRTLAVMVRWSEQGEASGDFAELDAIRREFDNSYTALAGLLVNSESAGSVGSASLLRRELSEQLVNAQNAAERARSLIADAEAREAAAAEQRAGLVGQIEAAETRATNLQAELEALRSETERLNHEAAQADLLRQREAELSIEVEDSRSRASALQAELEALRSEAERLGHEATQLGQQARSLEEGLAAQQDALQAARNEAEFEWNQRLAAETKLTTLQADLREEALRSAELLGRSSAAESALVQRQEELAQLWEKLLAAEKAVTRSEALAFQESQRRLESEQRLITADSMLTELRANLAEARAASVSASAADHLYAEIAQLTRMLQEQEAASKVAETALTATECKLAACFDEITRMTVILAEESGRALASAADADWLRKMAETVEHFPRWWALMPSVWRRKREHARYLRAGLFDAGGYLDIYPDVAAHGMDPVRHYMLHGMAEGRSRPK